MDPRTADARSPRAPLGLALLLGLVPLACHAASARDVDPLRGQRPNVVLVMADDLGWGDTGYNGHPDLRTPALDALAADGLVLDRFYAAAPVCSPTRGSVLTGRHPLRYGIPGANSGHLPAEEWTLAELLRREGYRTGHFGKWHLGTLTNDVLDGRRGGRKPEHYAPPWEHGFDVCFSTEQAVATWDPMDNQFLDVPTRYWTGPGEFATENLSGDDSRVILDRALPFIESAAADGAPFLAVIWLHAPHQPVIAGPDDRAAYGSFQPGQQHYYGVVSALDREVGRLRATLESAGVADRTLLWFTSDNGPEGKPAGLGKPEVRYQGSAGPFRGRKRSLLEGGVRVPGIVSWPGRLAAGSRSSVPMSTSDVLPTVAELVGFTLPADRPYDGLSLLPFWSQEQATRDDPIGFESRKQQAWSAERYKLYSNDGGESYALYDLLTDPGESTDLAADQPDRVQAMRAELAAWRESLRRSAEGADYR